MLRLLRCVLLAFLVVAVLREVPTFGCTSRYGCCAVFCAFIGPGAGAFKLYIQEIHFCRTLRPCETTQRFLSRADGIMQLAGCPSHTAVVDVLQQYVMPSMCYHNTTFDRTLGMMPSAHHAAGCPSTRSGCAPCASRSLLRVPSASQTLPLSGNAS